MEDNFSYAMSVVNGGDDFKEPFLDEFTILTEPRNVEIKAVSIKPHSVDFIYSQNDGTGKISVFKVCYSRFDGGVKIEKGEYIPPQKERYEFDTDDVDTAIPL